MKLPANPVWSNQPAPIHHTSGPIVEEPPWLAGSSSLLEPPPPPGGGHQEGDRAGGGRGFHLHQIIPAKLFVPIGQPYK